MIKNKNYSNNNNGPAIKLILMVSLDFHKCQYKEKRQRGALNDVGDRICMLVTFSRCLVTVSYFKR